MGRSRSSETENKVEKQCSMYNKKKKCNKSCKDDCKTEVTCRWDYKDGCVKDECSTLDKLSCTMDCDWDVDSDVCVNLCDKFEERDSCNQHGTCTWTDHCEENQYEVVPVGCSVINDEEDCKKYECFWNMLEGCTGGYHN